MEKLIVASGYFDPIHGLLVLVAVIVVLAGSFYLLIRKRKRSKNIDPLVPSLLIICIWIAFGIGTIVHLIDNSGMMMAFISIIGCTIANMGSVLIKLHFRAVRHQSKSSGDSPESENNQVKTEEWIISSGLILSILCFLILGYSLLIDQFIFSVLLSIFLVGIGGVAFILEGVFALIRFWWLKSQSVK